MFVVGGPFAYAEFDKAGNYQCNPFRTDIETNIYISIVQQINNYLHSYTTSYPNSTAQEQHDFLTKNQIIWDLYNKSRLCIENIGINPDDIALVSQNVKHAITIPEFGSLSGMIFLVSTIGVIIGSRRFRYF
jgi:hypothetical protein